MRILTTVKLAQLSQAFAWLALAISILTMLAVFVSPAIIQLYQTVSQTGIPQNAAPQDLPYLKDVPVDHPKNYWPPNEGK